MGSPNFIQDTQLLNTFGMNLDIAKKRHLENYGLSCDDIDDEQLDEIALEDISAIRSELDDALEDVQSHFFELATEGGYFDGFIIESQVKNCSVFYTENNLDYAKNFAIDCIIDSIKSKRLLKTIRKHWQSHPNTKETDYVENLLDDAFDGLELFDYGVLLEHYQKMIDRLEQRGMDTNNDDDTLISNMLSIFDKQLLLDMINSAINDDIQNIDNKLTEIAQDFGLKKLTGGTWTSYFADVGA